MTIFRKIIIFIKSIPTILKNIKHYWKFIANDRQFDYHYIYELLYTKFDYMSKYYDKGVMMHYIGEEITHKEIKICKELCSRIINNFYSENAYVKFNKQYPNYYDDFINNINKEMDKGLRKKILSSAKHEGYMIQSCINYLHDIMKRKSIRWWD